MCVANGTCILWRLRYFTSPGPRTALRAALVTCGRYPRSPRQMCETSAAQTLNCRPLMCNISGCARVAHAY